MPELSIVVPVYNVAPYADQCFESILGQAFTDFELIVVDDASTDGSTVIVDDLGRRDERVSVIKLEDNRGLGNARNVGLQAAGGDYVMFVDSDDWLEADALQAILQRARATNPDVLIYDYARTSARGRVRIRKSNVRHELFAAAGQDVFTVREHPELLSLLTVAWNKLYRRAFIDQLGLRFPAGYYEDIPWTLPALLAAERITLLDEICYFYRQRRHGNILGTSSAKHLDVLAQYERVFAFMDERPELADLRSAMFERMVRHYLIVLGKGPRRIPPELHRQFFRLASRHYVRYRPPGHVAPMNADGIKRRLLQRNAYGAFQRLERVKKVAIELRRALRRRRVRWRRRGRVAAARWRHRARRLAIRRLQSLPIDEHLAVFAAHRYRAYACNPRAIYEKLGELAPDIRAVWVVNPSLRKRLPEGLPHVMAGSLAYHRVVAQAKYLVNNVDFPAHVVKRPGTVHLHTHHGTPFGSVGLDLQNHPVAARRINFAKLMRGADRWDYALSSNRFSSEIWGRAYPAHYTTLEYGYPRNDIFHAFDEAYGAAVRQELGIDPDKTVVLYVSTRREYQRGSQLHLNLIRLSEALGDRFVFLVRAHYSSRRRKALRGIGTHAAVINVSGHPEIERLCLASDLLVTDYSPIMFDYANLGRPVVIYAHDWEIYRRVRGVYFDLFAEPPGVVATTEEELLDLLESKEYASDEAMARLDRFRRRFCEYDDGFASERVVRRVFLGEEVELPVPLVSEPRARSGTRQC
ncbi:MAG: CDP-glycerol glycerophosphotransferase family protein [Euzebyales bacterium]|nr:CDP-glycerol glycerophosphotransferase family protein [Euzebyales bacterium]